MAEIDISELNRAVCSAPQSAVADAERTYHNRVEAIADHVRSHPSIRIILLAGPSGSGKTTTANLIKDAVIRRGEQTIVVSLDDFYRDAEDKQYPRLENGERDFECPESLRLSEVSDTLCDICEGRAFYLPKYDFKVGRRVENTLHPPMPGGCVIIEGLHALNPKISSGLNPAYVLKLFVSVSTNVNLGGERILSGRKIRFLRRLVRDSIYRASDADRTLGMWGGVLHGEDMYLYPYKGDADIAFDTFHSFELGAMKPYAETLLTEEVAQRSEYAAVVRDSLRHIATVDEELIPDNSLIREFIPGGIYEHLY